MQLASRPDSEEGKVILKEIGQGSGRTALEGTEDFVTILSFLPGGTKQSLHCPPTNTVNAPGTWTCTSSTSTLPLGPPSVLRIGEEDPTRHQGQSSSPAPSLVYYYLAGVCLSPSHQCAL